MNNNAPISGKLQSVQDKKRAVERTADIAWALREQIRASLPTPSEQFLTIMVPGKVLNFEDFKPTDKTEKNTSLDVPIDVQFREAMLVDDMPAMSGVQLGPTGKSISNAYAATLDRLVPSGTTIGVGKPANPEQPDDPQTRFQDAMNWLASPGPNEVSRMVEYSNYQQAHSKCVDEKKKAFRNARKEAAKLFPDSLDQQKNFYGEWVQENYEFYNDKTQAAYMQWVVHGLKETVEHYFSLVDVSSCTQRIEKSKESMRNSVIATPDGSMVFNRVYLEPTNWADIASQKSNEIRFPKGKTPEDIQFEINSLEFKMSALRVREASASASANDLKPIEKPPADDNTELDGAMNQLLTASRKFEAEKKTDMEKKSTGTDESLKNAKEGLATARQALLKAQQNHEARTGDTLRFRISQDADSTLLQTNIKDETKATQSKIDDLKKELEGALEKNKAQDNFTKIVEDESRPKDTRSGATQPSGADYWTRISAEVGSSTEGEPFPLPTSQGSESSTSYSAGGAASWGLWSIGGSYAHSDATAKVASQMSNLACSVSFDVMRVDINRPWLRAELFYDADLDAAPSAKISPGPALLGMLMESVSAMPSEVSIASTTREKALKDYSLFPFYSTAFLLAANVVLELKGQTSDISAYFRSSQNSGSGSIGYGPFSISGTYSRSSSEKTSNCQTTSEGCRITITAPQIIGWVSQMLPALPRIQNGKPPIDVVGWNPGF